MNKPVFPIHSATACQLKWNWSTVYLTMEETASCHRSNKHRFDTEQFEFHNTASKIADRERMLTGQWPEHTGCDYCRNIEEAGGISERLSTLHSPNVPKELLLDAEATTVTPKTLEIYFDNVCNQKCLYCSPLFSSLWEAENRQYGPIVVNGQTLSPTKPFTKSANIEQNKQKIFKWLQTNVQHLTTFNILGGEPLYQQELEQCLDLFEEYPAPNLKLQIFTNLNARPDYVERVVERVKSLIAAKKLQKFEVTASLDCWGAEQEYVRYPMDLTVWEKNFTYLLHQHWINLIIGSTVTPLTIKTLPDLLQKINQWNQVRPVHHFQNSVDGPSMFFIDIFGDIFVEDFERAVALKPYRFPEQRASREYLKGIGLQSASKGPNLQEINKLHIYLNEIDRRRGTNWKETFPWLVTEFDKYFG